VEGADYMIGSDSDNLKSFVADATAFRNAELAKAKPIDVRGFVIAFSDGKFGRLDWSTGIVDTNGVTLPPDWIIHVDG
jgi:hypothetical protein